MSILLEALKKAALEKQRRDLGDDGVGRVDDAHLESPPANGDLPEEHKHEPGDIDSDDHSEFSLDVDFDALIFDAEQLNNIEQAEIDESSDNNAAAESEEKNELSRQFTLEQEAERVKEKSSDREKNKEINAEHNIDNNVEHIDLLASENPKRQNNGREYSNEDIQSKIADNTAPSTVKPPENNPSLPEDLIVDNSEKPDIDNNTQEEVLNSNSGAVPLDNTSSDRNLESNDTKQKESFILLLEKNRKLQKQKKRKFIVLYLLLAIFFSLAVCIYFLSVHFTNRNTLLQYVPAVKKILVLGENVSAISDELPVVLGDQEHYEIDTISDVSNTKNTPDETNNASNDNGGGDGKLSEQALISQGANKNAQAKPVDSSPSLSKSKDSGVTISAKETQGANEPSSQLSTSKPLKNDISTEALSSSKAASPIVTKITNSYSQVDSLIHEAYIAFKDSDYTKAKKLYSRVLENNPHQKDALLGSAAIAVSQGNIDEALNLYQLRLNRAPNDSYAHSGLLSIATNRKDSPELLSSVNNLLSDYPEAAHLYFLKGVIHNQDAHWAAAQDAFFNAWSRDEQRRDYAYNLAIALDHLQQKKQALRFYRMALSAQGILPVAIDVPAVHKRINALELLQ